MKYKVGDVVKVHSLQWFNMNVSKVGSTFVISDVLVFVPEMQEFCDRYVTIENVITGVKGFYYYAIKEDNHNWVWTDEMFDDLSNNKIGNYNIVEEMAKILKIEVEQPFYGDNGFQYRLSNLYGIEMYDADRKQWLICAMSLISFMKMCKEYKFSAKWIPNKDDEVFFMDIGTSALWRSTVYEDTEHDRKMLEKGLYFRTKEEAIEYANKFLNEKEG